MSLMLQISRRPRDWHDTDRPIVIGIVNNMPDPALQSTERQFCELLSAASGGRPICIQFFSLPGLPRGRMGRLHVRDHYREMQQLCESGLDGLIVTGTEPSARALRDEPYWSALGNLVDWAGQNTVSTIWSCLAVHAAVDHLDGIERCPLSNRLFGVFECVRSADHPVVGGFGPRWRVPHSRYNGLSEETLVSSGYKILARSRAAGVDTFVKNGKSLFLFLQGHLEYDPTALLREYRRDVNRFLVGDRDTYPEVPCSYFSEQIIGTLLEFREQVMRDRDAAALARFPITEAKRELIGPWRAAAVQLYTNWLSYLTEHRSGQLKASNPGRFVHPYPTLTVAHSRPSVSEF